MAIPKDKTELLLAIRKNYDKLRSDLASVPPELASIVELPGHTKDTQMSVCNLVAYLIGWGQLVLKWHRKTDAGEVVTFPDDGFKWNQLGPLAQKFYSDYHGLAFDQLLENLNSTVEQLIHLVLSKLNDELYGEPWYDKYTMGRMIQLNTSSPYANARARLRTWKREKKLP